MKTYRRESGEQEEMTPLAVAEAIGAAMGRCIGESLGRAIGETFGAIAGIIRGRAECILRILDKRRISVDARTRGRILACTDLERLDRWFDQALTATSIEDLHLNE